MRSSSSSLGAGGAYRARVRSTGPLEVGRSSAWSTPPGVAVRPRGPRRAQRRNAAERRRRRRLEAAHGKGRSHSRPSLPQAWRRVGEGGGAPCVLPNAAALDLARPSKLSRVAARSSGRPRRAVSGTRQRSARSREDHARPRTSADRGDHAERRLADSHRRRARPLPNPIAVSAACPTHCAQRRPVPRRAQSDPDLLRGAARRVRHQP